MSYRVFRARPVKGIKRRHVRTSADDPKPKPTNRHGRRALAAQGRKP